MIYCGFVKTKLLYIKSWTLIKIAQSSESQKHKHLLKVPRRSISLFEISAIKFIFEKEIK